MKLHRCTALRDVTYLPMLRLWNVTRFVSFFSLATSYDSYGLALECYIYNLHESHCAKKRNINANKGQSICST